ncbi:MAG: DEAD/DEAH box helicase, partial [Planctomycetaceae bacterium]
MHPVPKVDPGFVAQHRELARRLVGLEPFPVQLDAGERLLGRVIAEMETGEGKTLAAALPLVVHGLRGGAWLATANDYLARRDAELLTPLFAAHGLSVGCIHAGQSAAERQRVYRCPVVYGTLREFGFDHLKDRLRARQRGVPVDQLPDRLQSPPGYLLLDEADSLLIDEATTPLVISLQGEPPGVAETALFQLADQLARTLQPEVEFVRQPPWGTCRLTSVGRRTVLASVWPPEIARFTTDEIHTAIERALHCHCHLARDVHYVVDRGKVRIVDEGTGRIGVDRQWQAGLHQAV